MATRLDFTATFAKIGGLLTKRLRRGLETQQDLRGNRFAPPALATLKARARLMQGTTRGSKLSAMHAAKQSGGKTTKGKPWKGGKGAKSVPLTRLYVTHDLALRGFKYDEKPFGVRVYVQEVPHIPFYGKDPSLADIVRWNSLGQIRVNPRLKGRAPLVFPNNEREVSAIMPEMKWAWEMLEREAARQMKEQLRLKLRTELRI